jgi:hypothetical protein
MNREFSQKLRIEVDLAVMEAAASHGTVNVPHVAEILRLQNIDENVAHEDVELLVVQQAQTLGIAMAFSADTPNLSLGIPGE